jgi:hypothetical protein
MSTFNHFTPGAVTGTLGVTTVAGGQVVALSGAGSVLRIANATTVPAFVALGTAAVTVAAGGTATKASDGGFPILGSSVQYITLSPNDTHLAGITGSGTTTLRINRGDGA